MKQPVKAPQTRVTTPKQKKKSREELDREARQRKQQKKRRGNTPGSRAQEAASAQKRGEGRHVRDSRLGSKVPVPLLVETPVAVIQPKAAAKADLAPKPLSPQQELERLENDPRLHQLLDRLDEGEILSQEDQRYVDETLDRIDALMVELGIELGDEDEEDEAEPREDILHLLKQSDAKGKH